MFQSFLIEEKKQSLNKPNIIYVKKFIEDNGPQSQSNQRRLKFLTSRSKKNELQEVKKSYPNDTNINNTYKNDIDNSVSQSVSQEKKNQKKKNSLSEPRQTDRQTK